MSDPHDKHDTENAPPPSRPSEAIRTRPSDRELLEEISGDLKTVNRRLRAGDAEFTLIHADIGMALNALHVLAGRVQANELELELAGYIRERASLLRRMHRVHEADQATEEKTNPGIR